MPWEFCAVLFIGVYIHPRACTDTALSLPSQKVSLWWRGTSKRQTLRKSSLSSTSLSPLTPEEMEYWNTVIPPFQMPTNLNGLPFSSAIQLLPAYRQRLKREPICKKEIRIWSEQSDSTLQDCEMFRNAADNNVSEFADTVTLFISKCTDGIVPKKTIQIFLNEKPWTNSEVRAALHARKSAFRSGNLGDTRAVLLRTIRRAKKDYAGKLEAQFESGDLRSTWQG